MKRSTIVRGAALAVLVAGCSSSGASSSDEPSTSDDAITSGTGAITDDSYVASEYPTTLPGGATYLKVGTAGPNLHHTYVKLNVTGIPAGATGISVRLTLHALSASTNPIYAHCGNSDSWTQATLDWSNQPGFAAADASSVPSVSAGANAVFDVSSCVSGNGAATIVLDQPAGPVTEFASIEDSVNPPTLAVTFTKPAARIVFGMFNNTAIIPGSEENSATNFRAIADRWMVSSKLKVHRVYNNDLPPSYAKSGGAADPANGNLSFLSVKPPSNDVAGVAAGKYDAQIAALAATIPAGSYFTMYHEPEGNISGPQFTAMFRAFYKAAKRANPKLIIGYVAMSYQWRPGNAATADEDSWDPGADSTDFLAADAYDQTWNGAHSLDTEADFQRWYAWAKTKNKPLLIPEYGVQAPYKGTGFTDAARATIITNSIAWMATQPQLKMMLYWDGTQATPGGIDHILNPTTSQPTDDFALSRAAWNAGVTKYGSSGTTY